MGYIELKNVTYTYPLAKEPSIKDVTISLEKGKFYAVVGANGSGKQRYAILSVDLFRIFSRRNGR